MPNRKRPRCVWCGDELSRILRAGARFCCRECSAAFAHAKRRALANASI
jgi:hypothetical protein